MPLIIRNALPADYLTVCALFAQMDRLHSQGQPHIFRTPPAPVRDEFFYQNALEDPDKALWVADLDGKLIGAAYAFLNAARLHPVLVSRSYVYVEHLVVDEGCRRQGIGRRLMQQAEVWAHGQGVSAIELNVAAFNREALVFYEHLGYRTISIKMQKPIT